MNPILKNTLAVITGFVGGSVINMGIIKLSGYVIPPPEGSDITTMEGLEATMHLMEPKHFLFPFLAHALGTLAGAAIASLIATTHKMRFALAIGVLFLMGGIANVFLLPSPTWFTILDLTCAYLPMAYLGGKIVIGKMDSR